MVETNYYEKFDTIHTPPVPNPILSALDERPQNIELPIPEIINPRIVGEEISKINKDVEVSTSQIGVLNADKAIKTYENTVLQPDQHNLALGQINKLASENAMLVTQEQMLKAQKNEIAPNAAKQRAVQDGQIAQMNAETAYTNSKQTVMVESRIDNLMLETLKAKLSHLSTVGAGGLTPSTNDFNTANSLISATYGRAKNYALPEITFAAGGAYTKAV